MCNQTWERFVLLPLIHFFDCLQCKMHFYCMQLITGCLKVKWLGVCITEYANNNASSCTDHGKEVRMVSGGVVRMICCFLVVEHDGDG